MKAKEIAEILLKNPELEVYVQTENFTELDPVLSVRIADNILLDASGTQQAQYGTGFIFRISETLDTTLPLDENDKKESN